MCEILVEHPKYMKIIFLLNCFSVEINFFCMILKAYHFLKNEKDLIAKLKFYYTYVKFYCTYVALIK